MSGPLLSPDWYRVAGLRPRLRAGLSLTRQQVRGQTWVVATDPLSGRHHRFSRWAWQLVAFCDGRRTLDDAWSGVVDAAGDAAPTQAEAMTIVGQAFSGHVLVGDVPHDAAAVVRLRDRRQGQALRQAINPLAFRLPLWHPDDFLQRHAAATAWLFKPGAVRCWLVFAALAVLALLAQAPGLAAEAQAVLSEPRGLLLMWLAYPFIKGLHELAHGFAVKAHGGTVPRMGVTLLMLTPVPYVDASASAAFESKQARALVAGVGIMVELMLAGLALVCWLLLEPSVLRDAALAVVLVGGLSTLLVNGNPLLRFDGYHVLCDLAELPNLAQRSRSHWLYVLQRRVLGLRTSAPVGLAHGEGPWLLAYAPLAWAMRLVLMGVLAHALADSWPVLSLLLALVALWLGLLGPALKCLGWLLRSPQLAQRRPRALAAAGMGVALVLVLAFVVPVQQRSHAPGVVWLPDDAMIRLETAGVIDTFMVRDGQIVAQGDAIAELSNPPLLAELARLRAQLQLAQVEQVQLRDRDLRAAAQAGDRAAQLAGELQSVQKQQDALLVRAASSGRVVLDTHRDRVGMHLPQGHLLAYVLPDGAPLVRALVGNSDIALVNQGTRSASVLLASGGAPLSALVDSAVPQASLVLPSAALGSAGGGLIAIDSQDSRGLTARVPHFQVDLALPPQARPAIGSRVMVTFEHGPASAWQWLLRQVRHAFLRHLPA